MKKRMRLFKIMSGMVLQVMLIVSFVFLEVMISPYIYLAVWCVGAKIVLSALAIERAV